MAPKTQKPAAENAAQGDAAALPEITEAGHAPGITADGEDSVVAVPALSEDTESPAPAETVEVVVRTRRTVRHEGETHGATALVTLPREDAERLKDMGFVDYLDELHEIAQVSQGVNVTVSGGVTFKRE